MFTITITPCLNLIQFKYILKEHSTNTLFDNTYTLISIKEDKMVSILKLNQKYSNLFYSYFLDWVNKTRRKLI